jgi:oxygen-independent coproporphyrinogen-3 oxidase
VNRLSVAQGLDAERLRFLGRLHEPEGGLAALAAASRADVPRVSGDLIYGVAMGAVDAPGEQGAADSAAEARAVARTGVGHVSAYSLTIEPGTQFGGRRCRRCRERRRVADAFSGALRPRS